MKSKSGMVNFAIGAMAASAGILAAHQFIYWIGAFGPTDYAFFPLVALITSFAIYQFYRRHERLGDMDA